MFKATRGLTAMLCSLVALAAPAQEGLLPDTQDAADALIYAGTPDLRNDWSLARSPDFLLYRPAWEEGYDQELLESRLRAWLSLQLERRLPPPETRVLLAEIKSANLLYLYRKDEAGNILRDAFGQPRLRKADDLWGPGGDHAAWSRGITESMENLLEGWEQQSTLICQEILSSLPADLAALGEKRLFISLAAYRQSVEREFERLYRQEESLFLYARLRDAVSLRERSEARTAAALTRAIIDETDAALSDMEATLAVAPAQPQKPLPASCAEDEPSVLAWQENFNDQLEKALEVWRLAENRLIEERIRWQRDAETGFLEGEKAWDAAFAELGAARRDWLQEFSLLAEEGARAWGEREELLFAGCQDTAAALLAGAEREAASRQTEIDGLLDDYRRSRELAELASDSIAGLEQQIARTADAAQRALCEEEINYWENIRSQYDARTESILRELTRLEDELLAGDGLAAGDAYTLELQRLQAKVELLQRQVGIAAAVVRYADCDSSERPSEAETAAEYALAKQFFEGAESDYLTALDLLEQCDRRLSEEEAMLVLLKQDIDAARSALSEAEEAYDIANSFVLAGDAALFDDLIAADLAFLRGYYESGRQTLFERLFYDQEKMLRNELHREAEDLSRRLHEGDSETAGIPELEQRLGLVSELQLDSALAPAELAARLQLAGIDSKAGYAAELREAYGACFQAELSNRDRALAALRAGYYLEKVKEEARLELARSLAAVEILQTEEFADPSAALDEITAAADAAEWRYHYSKALLERQALRSLLSPEEEIPAGAARLAEIYSLFGSVAAPGLESRIRDLERVCAYLSALQSGEILPRERVVVEFLQGRDAFAFEGFNYADCFLLEELAALARTRTVREVAGDLAPLSPGFLPCFRSSEANALREIFGPGEDTGIWASFARLEELRDLFTALYPLHLPPYLLETIRRALAFRVSDSLPDPEHQLTAWNGRLTALEELEILLRSGSAGSLAQAGLAFQEGLPGGEQYLTAALAASAEAAMAGGLDFDTAFWQSLAQSGVSNFSPLPVAAYIGKLALIPEATLREDGFAPLLDGPIEDFVRRRYDGVDLYSRAILVEAFFNPGATLSDLQEGVNRRYIENVLEAVRCLQNGLERDIFIFNQLRELAGLPREREIRLDAATLLSDEAEFFHRCYSLAVEEFGASGFDAGVTRDTAAAAAEQLNAAAREAAEIRDRIEEYREALEDWQADAEAYNTTTLQPLAARLEECRTLYEQSLAVYHDQLASMDALFAAWNAARGSADSVYRSYREAEFRLQEAEEISDYAWSGSVTGAIEPHEILARRQAEYQRARRIRDLLTAFYETGEQPQSFAVRNPGYASLRLEQLRLVEMQSLLGTAREQLQARLLSTRQASVEALKELNRRVCGLVDLGDLEFTASADSFGLGCEALTDFSNPDLFTAEQLDAYFSNSDGSYFRDLAIWFKELGQRITPEDLAGEGLEYVVYPVPPEYQRWLLPGTTELRFPVGLSDTGLMGLLKDFAFAYFYETGDVEIAAERQQAYGLLCEEIDADPAAFLRACGKKLLDRLEQDPALRKLYGFFRLLLTQDRLLADTAFMGRDLSFAAVQFLKEEANAAIDDIKRRYPIIHIFMAGRKKRIRGYRDSLQLLDGGEGKQLLVLEVDSFSGCAETWTAREAELTLLAGKAGMTCPQFMQALDLVLDGGIGAETADYIRSTFPVQADGSCNGAAAILDLLVKRAAADREAVNGEIEIMLAELRGERAAATTEYRHLLESRDIDWQELERVARALFYNPEFTEEDRLRSDLETARTLQERTSSAELPAVEMRVATLLALFRHDLAVALEERNAELSLELELLRNRRLEWQERIEALYTAAMREWQASFAALGEKRKTWERGFAEEYEEKVALWDRKYALFAAERRNWLRESAERGYATADAALARELGIAADSLTSGVANIIIPDMSPGTPRLSSLIAEITGSRGLADILEGTRGISAGIDHRLLLRQSTLPLSGSYRRNCLAFEQMRSRLADEIYQKAVLVNALRMREIVSMTEAEIQTLITEANADVARQIGNTLEAAGYLKQGTGFSRSALIDRSLLGGIEKERQFIKGYREYRAPELDTGVDLDRSLLEGLSGEMIQAAVKTVVARLQEYLQLIFGEKEPEEATSIGAELRARLETEREKFRSSSQYADYTELKGFFAMHVGYAPVMNEDDPEEVARSGYGEYGRIFELFLRNEARLARGLATLSIPLYDLRLWDDDRDNDGEPDGWFHAPTPRGIIDLGVSIVGTVLLGPGTGMLAMTLADDVVFTGLDVAGGRTSWSEAGLGLTKQALAGLASQGFASFNAAAMAEIGGSVEGVIAKTIFTGGSGLAENMITGVIGAVQIGSHGLTLDSDLLRASITGAGALADVAAGATGTFVREGLNALTLSAEDVTGFSHLDIADAGVFNRTMGSLASAAVEYGLSGETALNLLNLRDFTGQAPEHGLLELHLGNRESYLNIGAGGYDLSPARIAQTLAGFDVHRVNRKIHNFSGDFEERTGYSTAVALRAEYSFGDDSGLTALRNILAGRDVLHIGFAGAQGMTVRRQDGGRNIYLTPAGQSLSDQLYLAVLLQHEAHRDGIVGTDNAQETREAVMARVLMSERIRPDYGDDFILDHGALVRDFIAYEMSRSLGAGFWREYVDNSYSSEADFARRILNWQRRGRVGVMPTPDAGGLTEHLFDGIAALARTLRLADGERLDITEKPPSEFKDFLAGALTAISLSSSFYTSGLVESFTADNLVDFTFSVLSPIPSLGAGSLPEILNLSAGIAQLLLKARDTMNYVLRNNPVECRKWHFMPDRDKQIFAMAEGIGIELSIPYNDTRSEESWKIIEQQMVNRYIWLGNMMFNDGITDPEDLKMLFYGPYVEVFDEEHGLRQYYRLPGYIDKEFRDTFGMGDLSNFKDDFFKNYIENFKISNILYQKSYLSAPVNWSKDHIQDVNFIWNESSPNASYYYSYTSYWELRYKDLMLSLEK